MSEEPLEGRILSDKEVERMRWYTEMKSSLINQIEEEQRITFQKMRAANFYRKAQADTIDRKGFTNFEWHV